MSEVRYDTLVARVRALLMEDPRISSEAEADAEMNLMPKSELVEVLSVVLGQMEADEREYVPKAT